MNKGGSGGAEVGPATVPRLLRVSATEKEGGYEGSSSALEAPEDKNPLRGGPRPSCTRSIRSSTATIMVPTTELRSPHPPASLWGKVYGRWRGRRPGPSWLSSSPEKLSPEQEGLSQAREEEVCSPELRLRNRRGEPEAP